MKEKETSKHKKLVLLDMHAILHRGYHALPDFTSSKGEPTGALYGLVNLLLRLVEDLKPDYVVAAYDLPEPTFRHEQYKEYKAGRAKTDDALVAQIVRSRDVLDAFSIPYYELPGFEADDILGTVVHEMKGKEHENVDVIIASGDMDTLQLVRDRRVMVYTLKKGINDTVLYDEDAVRARFGFSPELLPDYKGLRGDPSDNIIGIPGIGEKTASEIISHFGSLEEIYKKLKKDRESFLKAGIKERMIAKLEEGEEEAMFSKMLATIRPDAPINFILPKKEWREEATFENIEKIFGELGFRSIYERTRKLFGGAQVEVEEEKEEAPDPREVKIAGIGLWLLQSDIIRPTLEEVLRYTGKKVFTEAKEVIEVELKEKGLEGVYRDIELPLISIIDRAETHGILIDKAHFEKLSLEYHEKLSGIEKKIWELAGGEFNINSPKQLGEILFDKLLLSVKGLKKTEGGARSTRESELLKLKGQHPIIDEILSHREIQKVLSTYIDVIPALADGEGRLHTSLNQTGTTTGRMSSTNPNLQNIPVRDGAGAEIRKGFVASPGCVFATFDYSQIEMRALAELSGDEKLRAVFQNGEDVHSAVASHVFGVAPEEVNKEMRRKAKVINFGIIYGMGVNALRANLGGTQKEAQEFYDNYFLKFPTIGEYFENVKREARKKGYTETLFGRRRYFPEIKSSLPFMRAGAERMAMNAPLQGTAADIVKLAMIKTDQEIQSEKMTESIFLLLQIHDELLFEVKKEAVEVAVPLLKNAMESAAKLSIPLVVNASTGQSWGGLIGYGK